MGELDGWAAKIGSSVCGYLARSDHDGLLRGLCSDGSTSAGWRLVIFLVVLAAVTFGMWRVLRPR